MIVNFKLIPTSPNGWDNDFNHQRNTINTVGKVVIGVAIGIFCLVVIFWISVFFYLRKHGRNFASLFRRGRHTVAINHHEASGPNTQWPSNDMNQEPGTYNPYANQNLPQQQAPSAPEMAHIADGQSKGGHQPPPYAPPNA
ncbi:hypothetical protein RhiLY_03319 [Ceratobasidium sp. AG-Ba]|nr:hypothetical protein RhiLY_03319 [Ceratobasidium sp. AG-Ba]